MSEHSYVARGLVMVSVRDGAEFSPAEAEALARELVTAAAEARLQAGTVPAHQDCPTCPNCRKPYGKPNMMPNSLACGGCAAEWDGTAEEYAQAVAAQQAWAMLGPVNPDVGEDPTT